MYVCACVSVCMCVFNKSRVVPSHVIHRRPRPSFHRRLLTAQSLVDAIKSSVVFEKTKKKNLENPLVIVVDRTRGSYHGFESKGCSE